MNYSGIEYMYRYLEGLNIENRFCSYFSNKAIEEILCGYSRYYQENLINIYEVVMGNAIGRILSENDLSKLSISEEDRQVVENLCSMDDQKKLENKMLKAFKSICSNMEFNEKEHAYLEKAVQSLSVRIKHNLENGCLDKVFITGREHIEKKFNSYQSGKQMENKVLRSVISEIKECRYVSDKIAIVKRAVKNLDDLTEILEECFWENEYLEVFPLLSDYELAMLRNRITEEQEYGCVNNAGSWKMELLAYINNKRKQHKHE